MMEGGRGRYWTEAEVTSLLDIFIENRLGPVLFHLQPRRNKDAFRMASRQLARLNYARNPRQIRSKFKTLRQNFNRCLYYFGEEADEEHQSAYWNHLLQLWIQADRPNPANLFPAGAGPGRQLGNRRVAQQPERNPERRIPMDEGSDGSEGVQALEEEIQDPEAQQAHVQEIAVEQQGGEQQQGDIMAEEPIDIMQQPVTRAEHQNWVAVLQDVAERLRAVEEIVLPENRGGPAPRRRRRRRRV